MGQLIGLIVFAVIVAIVIGAVRKAMGLGPTPFEMERWRRRMPLIVTTALVLLVVFGSVVVVPVGHSLVVYNYVTRSFSSARDPGYWLVLPVITERYMYDTRTQVYTMSGVHTEGDVQGNDAIEVLSNDGLKMDLDITVQYRIDETKVNQLHREIGPEFVQKIIRPTVREAIRNEFARHEATEAYSTKRDEIETKLTDSLVQVLSKYYIVLQEVQIRNIELPATVVAAIESKKAAQQDSERMQYVLEKERQEKERVKIVAEAEALKIKTINDSLMASPSYLHWLAIDKLNDNIELVISDGKTILDLDAYRGGAAQ